MGLIRIAGLEEEVRQAQAEVAAYDKKCPQHTPSAIRPAPRRWAC